jgi:L-ascorbate metabolism protein UlaG (beta-lactamase superfamily)
LGHATLFVSIPLKSTKGTIAIFSVITDLVEGDLHPIFYPRQTKVARAMEQMPAPDVYILSHNHLDHFCKATIKKIFDQQPIMIVPKGDGNRYKQIAKKLGLNGRNIIELN